MCSKSEKCSVEIGIQCGKLNIKMFPVRTEYADTHRIAYPSQLLHMLIFSVDESGNSTVKSEENSGK